MKALQPWAFLGVNCPNCPACEFKVRTHIKNCELCSTAALLRSRPPRGPRPSIASMLCFYSRLCLWTNGETHAYALNLCFTVTTRKFDGRNTLANRVYFGNSIITSLVRYALFINLLIGGISRNEQHAATIRSDPKIYSVHWSRQRNLQPVLRKTQGWLRSLTANLKGLVV